MSLNTIIDIPTEFLSPYLILNHENIFSKADQICVETT